MLRGYRILVLFSLSRHVTSRPAEGLNSAVAGAWATCNALTKPHILIY
jgi:hypothetical protein